MRTSEYTYASTTTLSPTLLPLHTCTFTLSRVSSSTPTHVHLPTIATVVPSPLGGAEGTMSVQQHREEMAKLEERMVQMQKQMAEQSKAMAASLAEAKTQEAGAGTARS